ncbi:MAG: flagellar export chaperone FliS, partial [bacterium]|nr:flagellar export chaperone FliS [bacterium]
MYNKSPHSAYQSVQVTTADRGRLLLMMYDGAIKFLKQSKAGLEENNIAKFCRFLTKGQAIIAELMNTLDFEKGGEIAKDLDRLYDFMLFYLTEANLYRDAKRVSKVIDLLDTV